MIKYKGLNHLAMATGDMDATVRFWRDMMEMKMMAAMGQDGFKQYIFQMSECDMLVFFEWPGVEPVEEKGHGVPGKGPIGFDHVSIGVESQDDLFKLKDKLNAADIWVSEVIDHHFIHSIYTFDPNGIAVEVSCAAEGAEDLKEPIFTDKSPSEVAKEGCDPNPDAWPCVEEPTTKEEYKVYPGDFFFIE